MTDQQEQSELSQNPDEPAGQEGERRVSLGTRVIMSLLLWGFTLLFAELFAGLAMPQVALRTPMREGGLVRPFRANSEADKVGPEFRVRYRINALGYRDAPRRIEREPGHRRVLCLGDSFTEGWGIPQDGTWPALLEGALSGFEFWNLGRSGGHPLFYLMRARRAIRDFKPDALIVQIFDNDPSEIERYLRRFEMNADGQVSHVKPRYQWTGSLSQRIRAFGDHLALRRLLRGRRGTFIKVGRKQSFSPEDRRPAYLLALLRGEDPTFNGQFGFFRAEQQEAWTPKFKRERSLLSQLVTETRTAGVKIALLYIPHRLVWDPALRKLRQPNHHRALLAALARDLALPFFDAQELLAKEPKPGQLYYPRDLHLTPAGQQALTRQMLKGGLRSFLKTLPAPR